MRVPGSLHLSQHLVWSLFLILVILIDVWHPVAVLIFISLVTDDAEYLFHVIVCHVDLNWRRVSSNPSSLLYYMFSNP